MSAAVLSLFVGEGEPRLMTYAAYLEAEACSEHKHEYLCGEVYAMAGETPEHAALIAAVSAELSLGLRGHPCRVYSSELRVRVEATDLSTYPDITVVCGALETASDDPNAATNPVLLVEVLSDSTEAYDRGDKFAHYRRLENLREYLLVSQSKPLLESYRKNAEGVWTLAEASAGEVLTLAAVEGVRLDVDGLYRDPLTAGQ